MIMKIHLKAIIPLIIIKKNNQNLSKYVFLKLNKINYSKSHYEKV